MDAELKSLRIDRSRKRTRGINTRWLLVTATVLVVIGLVWVASGRLERTAEVEVVRVRSVSSAGAHEGETILSATGYIIAAHKIELASKVPGKVAWIGVEKGDHVKQGQVLVRLEDTEYRARLLEAEGQFNSLKARLATLENGSRPEETARSQAELEEVRADFENARATLNRTQGLVEQGVLSKQALDDARARYQAQQAKFNSYEKSYALVRLGPRHEEIAAMRAQVKQAEGALAFAKSQVEETMIRAPIAGVVLERNVERGEFVTTGFVGDRGAKGYVVSLADLTDLQVELDINQNDFAKLGLRQPASITTEAYPDRPYQGFVEEISPEANRQKATVQVKVKVANPDAYLRPEMNASVAFRSAKKVESAAEEQPLLVIPAAAVREGAVFVLVEGKASRRLVQITGTTSQGLSVASGLTGGEDLISNPPEDLKDGQKVSRRDR